MRIGLGIDAHAFSSGRRLMLGGVHIAGSDGLVGHSDADVLAHAVADAILGAARLGDIGTRFPADDRWRDASSMDILAEVATLLAGAGFELVDIDSTVVAQRPRLAPFVADMAGNVAEALGVSPDSVSVKATSTDALGFTGRGEGIAALAVALIRARTGGQ